MSDGDDDPQLRSLRAVWLSLPDEEPPQTGMAQLMAAARVQAEHMARPSLWHRALELFRRPSVLALATIIVLIGGVVFVGRHRGKLEADKAAAPELSRADRQDVTSETRASGAGPGSAASIVVEQPPKADKAEESQSATPVTTPATPPRHKQEPAPEKTRVGRFGEPAKAAPGSDKDDDKDKDPVVGAAGGEAVVTNTTTIATDAPIVETKAAVEPRDRRAAANQPAITQLLAQCRAAATRGDCAAVRVIASRIAKQDAAFYRERVAKDITLTTCLAAE